MNKNIGIIVGIILLVLAIVFLYILQKVSSTYKIVLLFLAIVSCSAGMVLMIPKSENTQSATGCPPGQSCQAPFTGDIPSGTIVSFGSELIPEGWLLCDGSPYSSSAYPNLYNAIGTNYGEGGSSGNFNVPDFRGMFLRGMNGTSNMDPDVEQRTSMNGGKSGNNLGSYQADDFAAHTHNTPFTMYQQNPITPWNTPFAIPNTDGSGIITSVKPNTTSSGGNETRPKNVYVNFIIKT